MNDFVHATNVRSLLIINYTASFLFPLTGWTNPIILSPYANVGRN